MLLYNDLRQTALERKKKMATATTFKWVLGGIAGCVLAHITLGAVGLDYAIHALGHSISQATGINLSAAFGLAAANPDAAIGCMHTGVDLASNLGGALNAGGGAGAATAAAGAAATGGSANLPIYTLER